MRIGTDPEFFILDEGGRSVPAHMRLPPKASPLSVASKGEKKGAFSFFRDGYAAEVNVPPAAKRADLIWSMQAAIDALRTFVLKEGERLTTSPGVEVTWEKMGDAPQDVLEVGCDPSEDAYTGLKKFPSLDPSSAKERFGGGHMHFSCTKTPKGEPSEDWAKPGTIPGVVKLLDLYLGLPLTFFFPSVSGFHRRLFYGQAGEFRFQDYGDAVGLEYRVPTPEIWGHSAIASWAFDTAEGVLARSAFLERQWDEAIEDDLRGAINTGQGVEDVLTALHGKFDIPLLRSLREVFQPIALSPLDMSPLVGWREYLGEERERKAA